MARIKAVLWKSAKAVNREYPVYLRIEANDQRQYISLGFRVTVKQFNKNQDGSVRATHVSAGKLNRIIDNAVLDAKNAVYDLIGDKQEVTPSAIKAAVLPSPLLKDDFIVYGKSYAAELRSLGKIPTARRYDTILHKLETCTGGRLAFSSLTTQFLRDYRTHLIEHYGNGPGTVATNFRAIKAIHNRAIRDQIVSRDHNPFLNIVVKEPRTTKRKLMPYEIDALQVLELKEGSIEWHVRNAFMFSFFCAGVRFSDVCLMRVENVRGGRLEYTMKKTNTPKSIGLVPSAQAIVDVYASGGDNSGNLLFPFLKPYDISTPEKLDKAIQSRNTIVNKNLKILAKRAGIGTDLSFHMSRHSFADFARREGWDVYRISKALGHRDIKVTEAYLKGFDTELIDEEMGKLFGGANRD